MKIGIFGQFYHSDADMYIQLILDALWHKDVEVVIEEQFLQIIDRNQNISDSFSELSTFTSLDDSYDLFFSIGGDGTLLRAVTYVRDLGIPIVGINTGRLGFLATLQKEKISEGLNQIVNG